MTLWLRHRLLVTVNLLGLPALALPAGLAKSGVPQGVQLIGDRYREDLCLAAGRAIEARLGVLTPIDPGLLAGAGDGGRPTRLE